MHPLMIIGSLPDTRQVSRDAARDHAILTALKAREESHRPIKKTSASLARRLGTLARSLAWRPSVQD